MKRFLKYTVYLLLLVILLFAGFMIYATLTDYEPPEQVVVYRSAHPDTLAVPDTFSVMTWNIGYCGLGKEMDFFYDGGKQVRASRENTLKYLKGVRDFLTANDSLDFMLLEEVDLHSKRTYFINELDTFKKYLPGYKAFFALNYKVSFVPVPVTQPMGKVESGLVLLSKYEPVFVERRDFPGQYDWPTRLFMLDRCFMVAHYVLNDGHELQVIVTHNSAFDGGKLKKEEMAYLKDYLLAEAEKGNRIIVGGDWNQNPPGFKDQDFNKTSGYKNFVANAIPEDYMPSGWQWASDLSVMSNRANLAPYEPGKTPTTLLDFFLLSPGTEVIRVKGIDLGFEYSDHQPVTMIFRCDAPAG
jgi:endonuclease/exonuclease/phosphatase family metal-dependent hydrolase